MKKRTSTTDQPDRDWKDVPEQHWQAWQAIFQNSQESLKLTAACPVCDQSELYRWYWGYTSEEQIIDGQRFVAIGGLWQWCSACRTFAHYRAAVPEWWDCDLEVNTDQLTPYPTAIEEAIQKKEKESGSKESV